MTLAKMFLARQECAKKKLEPILQEMMVKEKERRTAHLHAIIIAATCVGQLVGKECGCVLMSDMSESDHRLQQKTIPSRTVARYARMLLGVRCDRHSIFHEQHTSK